METNEHSAAVTFREALSSAVRYWEPRRVAYNGTLLIVVAGAFIAGWPTSKKAVNAELLLVFFILAVLANVAYCAAYVPDVALQHTSYRDSWLRVRWILMVTGTLMASAIAYLFVAGWFGLAPGNY